DPQELIDTMGADTARLFVMFASPPEQTLEWADSGVDGANRFLRRVWNYCHTRQESMKPGIDPTLDSSQLSSAAKALRLEIHALLKQADYDYQRIQYNTVVSGCMKMLNTLEGAKLESTKADHAALAECVSILLRVLYPVVPHMCWDLWNS